MFSLVAMMGSQENGPTVSLFSLASRSVNSSASGDGMGMGADTVFCVLCSCTTILVNGACQSLLRSKSSHVQGEASTPKSCSLQDSKVLESECRSRTRGYCLYLYKGRMLRGCGDIGTQPVMVNFNP